MAAEPPPNVLRASKLRTGQIRGKMRTGAKTATKDQERDYLERFAQLAEDWSPLVPEWKGEGSDPFARTRRKLEKRSKKRESKRWLKWYARGKGLEHAYAHMILILRGGKIPSFASMKFRGRDVKFILRGRGLRDKLIAVQNHDQPDARLLGFLDVSRAGKIVLVSLEDAFHAYPSGGPVDDETFRAALDHADLELAPAKPHRCRHADETHPHIRFQYPQLGQEVAVCRSCLLKLNGVFTPHLEAYVLAPGGKLLAKRSVGGTSYVVHPETEKPEFQSLIDASAKEAQEKTKQFENARDVDVLDWSLENLQERIANREKGSVIVGDDLWLGDFPTAAKKYGADEIEQDALAAAWELQPPKVRVGDAQVGKMLDPIWAADGSKIISRLAPDLDPTLLEELASQRPSDALAGVGRALAAEKRFAEFPRLQNLSPAVRFVHDLFRAHRTGDKVLYQRRVQQGLKDPALKPILLALARAFGQSSALEWQYAPHEKDQALYFEPVARALAIATPATFVEDLSRVAEALGAPAPTAT